MNKTSATKQGYDLRAIKEFLMHLGGELRVHEFALQGKPVPPKLEQGVTQFRNKSGNELLPDAGLLCFLAADPEDEENAQRDAARQAMVSRRREQVKQVKGVIDLLSELEM